ncbi:MAG: hypothetical protein O7E51_02295 [Acidobacteria bacterium]|nr:hypothetical protein [Acidobacteriota bacterium]
MNLAFMNPAIVRLASLFVLTLLLAGGTAYAQEHEGQKHEGMSHEKSSATKTSSETPPTIFCPTMTTGQLCSHGTADALKLSGAKRESWVAAARRYNKAVDAATKQLQEDMKSALTPEQLALVELWFAEGLNPEINRILAAKQ